MGPVSSDPLTALVEGRVPWVRRESDGRWSFDAPRPGLLFPGSFNPLHHGHRQLALIASQRSSLPLAFELSIANVDKPSLPPEEVARRLEQFAEPIYITRSPTFLEKALHFPGHTFLVGIDTAIRIVDLRYYGDREKRKESLEIIRVQQCRFLVAGRKTDTGFLELNESLIPEEFRELFEGIGEAEFRVDVSSTELRRG
jgi:hypothetical protein